MTNKYFLAIARHATATRFLLLRKRGALLSTVALFASGALTAAEPMSLAEADKVIALPELTVEAEAEKEKGDISIAPEALPAQVDVISREDVAVAPANNFLDLLRRSPGVIPRGLLQGDIGEGFSVRGFGGGHGTSNAIFVDGVPLNTPNHAHAHGLTDANWLVPEMIERIEVIKGPFSALYGNFALGAVINIVTKRSDPAPTIGAEVGSYDTYRAFGSYSRDYIPGQSGVTPFLFYEGYDRGGYVENSELERYNAFNKITFPFGNGDLSLRASAVKRDFGAPGTLEVDRVAAGFDSRRDSVLNDTDGGDSEYYSLVANYIPRGEAGLNASIFAGHDELNRFATFSRAFNRDDFRAANPGLTDTELDALAAAGNRDITVRLPVNLQGLEATDRDYVGAKIFYNWVFNDDASLLVGTDLQYDTGDYIGIVTDQNRGFLDDVKNNQADTFAAGLFAQGQIRFFDRLKAVVGVRYDSFDTDVENRLVPVNSGSAKSDIVSPKFGLVFNATSWLDIYANSAKGFRSAAADELSRQRGRGPLSGVTPGTPAGFRDIDPFELDTLDVGLVVRPTLGLTLNANYYQTDTQGEIRLVTLASGVQEFRNVGDTERDGFEFSADYLVSENLSLYASLATSDGRLSTDQNGAAVPSTANQLTGVSENSQSLGFTWRNGLRNNMTLVVDGYYQRQGEFPLLVDGSRNSPALNRFGVRTSLSRGPVGGFLQLTYVPDEFASESYSITAGRERFAPLPETEVLVGLEYAFE